MRNWLLSNVIWYGSIVILLLFMLIFNNYTPYLSDDYCAHIRGAGVKEAFLAGIDMTIWGWNNMGGCLLMYFYSNFFLNFNKAVFNLVNSLVATSTILLMLQIINIKQNRQIIVTWTLGLLFLSLVPVPTQVLFWVVGAIQYSWALFVVLLYILPFTFYDDRREKQILVRISTIISPLLGLVAGNSQGAVGGVCVIISLLYIVKWTLERRHIPLWAYVGSLFAAIGCALMVSAPGNFKRAGNYDLLSVIVQYTPKPRCSGNHIDHGTCYLRQTCQTE